MCKTIEIPLSFFSRDNIVGCMKLWSKLFHSRDAEVSNAASCFWNWVICGQCGLVPKLLLNLCKSLSLGLYSLIIYLLGSFFEIFSTSGAKTKKLDNVSSHYYHERHHTVTFERFFLLTALFCLIQYHFCSKLEDFFKFTICLINIAKRPDYYRYW